MEFMDPERVLGLLIFSPIFFIVLVKFSFNSRIDYLTLFLIKVDIVDYVTWNEASVTCLNYLQGTVVECLSLKQ